MQLSDDPKDWTRAQMKHPKSLHSIFDVSDFDKIIYAPINDIKVMTENLRALNNAVRNVYLTNFNTATAITETVITGTNYPLRNIRITDLP